MKQKEKKIGNKRVWAGLLITLACMMMSVPAFAADTTMKDKKWITGQGGAYADTDKDGTVDIYQSAGTTYYKIQIPKQGYNTMKWQ